jgi:hypothetical protein
VSARDRVAEGRESKAGFATKWTTVCTVCGQRVGVTGAVRWNHSPGFGSPKTSVHGVAGVTRRCAGSVLAVSPEQIAPGGSR